MHAYNHAELSAKKYGGVPEDYMSVHNYLDATKEMYCDFRHRALRHHSQGIFEAERVLGATIINSDGKTVPVRYIAEDHVKQDCGGFIPSVSDWLSCIKPSAWMSRPIPYSKESV